MTNTTREIKFRAWSKVTKKLFNITGIFWNGGTWLGEVGKYSGSGDLIDVELMQYTGVEFCKARKLTHLKNGLRQNDENYTDYKSIK